MKSYRKIILASNNSHKVNEIKAILRDFQFEIVSLMEAGIEVEVEEDGKTFEENAYKKAISIMNITGEAAIADDSGLEVYALGGAPGVYSARFSGEHGDDKKNNEKLIDMMKDIPYDKRGARFVSSIVLLFPDGKEIKAEGYVEGIIGYEEKGDKGFGYDPLFIVPSREKTFAELQNGEKNAISHRGMALELLRGKLKELGL